MIARVLRDEDGGTLAEYALGLAIIAVASLGAVTAFVAALNSQLSSGSDLMTQQGTSPQ